MTRAYTGLLSFAISLVLAAAAAADAPAEVPALAPVSDADVARLQLHHYFDAKGNSQVADFKWTFKDDGTFIVKAGKSPIPAGVREFLLGEPMQADVLTGKWSLTHGRPRGLTLLRFTHVSPDGKDRLFPDAGARIYRSAPNVIRFAQYVFTVETDQK